MREIQSARVLREVPKNTAKTVDLYGISAWQPHWLAGFTDPLLALGKVEKKNW